MASSLNALCCAVIGGLLWTGVGWLFARRLFGPSALAVPLAPALGWAIQNSVALAAALVAGFSRPAEVIATALLVTVGLLLPRSAAIPRPDPARVPTWIWLGAGLLALAPAAAILPKFDGDLVSLAEPIFDHSKIALIDEMVRSGVPPANPVFGEFGQPGQAAYYYLWHFGAAQLARLSGASGWEADIGSTWFTAFASLMLMAGIAVWLSRRWQAAGYVLLASATASLRPVLAAVLGEVNLAEWLEYPGGFEGWLFQATWSPHHVASATCAVLTTLVLIRFFTRPDPLAGLSLVLLLAAGFESSVWVGGVTVAIAGGLAALFLLGSTAPSRRPTLILLGLAVATAAVGMVSPLLIDQMHSAALRGGGVPIAIEPFSVLGPALPETVRTWLDWPAYWLILLPITFPAILVPGLFGWRQAVRDPDSDPDRRRALTVFGMVALASLAVGSLLTSTVGFNNDLGWRAVLPAVMILTIFTAAGLARWLTQPARGVRVGAFAALFLIGLPGGAEILARNLTGTRVDSARTFATTPAMWAAVRRHAGPLDRIANNPRFLADLTPWPVNLSWALLADRRSCFAGNELALAFAPLTAADREAIDALFVRVFAGAGSGDDVAALANRYGCRAAVLTRSDGAWDHDPFAASPWYHLAESAPDHWRIYLVSTPPS